MKKISEAKFVTYHNHRAEPYFTFVKNGQKTIEGRIKKGYYCLIKAGDHIIIFNEEETDSVEVIVKRTRDYLSIRDMLKNESLEKILPDVKNVEEGIKVYQKFYTIGQERKFGVVAIEIEKVCACAQKV